ncbi:uncharacterized protein LOC106665245 isoform X2 [Cimex lectularius]|uniref:LIM zinc-binding domain-containing protein n=1 Tax=Cimex lectularius TaxID=79782 RepID=A0A8I6SLD1_CIMLE|nr:uncharacterized protein LOC106665245 isoform X2 [Cimex lectularius]XP_014247025.1 uncharacterized protein LOC106665245 isoform X2 [Cimex lectularius]XP_024085337.1 uncharacterized protein LOC106665245 isoform X2 [Cimex lectularius]
MERRLSTTSESSNDSRQSCDSGDGVQGRVPKSMSPKVAVNPLQFVKVGPCDLYRSAQEQLKKVEEIKKVKKVCKDEGEDWQSNLDNWKCSRRKRQEHIIERVVEVKKLELEEHERNRRKSKTFSEMMQDRNIRGRKTSLPVYQYDDTNDLSDLGLTSTKTNNDKTDGEKVENGEDEPVETLNDTKTECNNDKREKTPPKSDNCEQYTYEWAIQSYVNFTESRVKSKSTPSINEEQKKYPPIPAKPSIRSTAKVDNYLKNVEQSNQNDSAARPAIVPKVSVNKQRELFEKKQESEECNKPNKTAEVTKSASIKERLSSLEKQQENVDNSKDSKINLPNEPLVKNRLMTIEAVANGKPSLPKKVVEPVTTISIKDRLSSLSKTETSPSKNKNIVEPTLSLKDRMNNLQSSMNKEIPKQALNISTPNVSEKIKETESYKKEEEIHQNGLERSYSPDDINSKRQQHFRHRSLDSLDVDSDNVGSSFERVQSLEDLDYCRNYPPSTFSGDTDREDSGIHTADVSSSVSQADDYDLHLDSNVLDEMKTNHQPPIVEESKHCELQKYTYEEQKPVSSPSEEEQKVGDVNSQDSLINNTVSQSFSSLSQLPDSNLNKVELSLDNSIRPSESVGINTFEEVIKEQPNNLNDTSETKENIELFGDLTNAQNIHLETIEVHNGTSDFKNHHFETVSTVSSPRAKCDSLDNTNDKSEIPKSFSKMPIKESNEPLVLKEIINPVEENQYKGIIMDVYSDTQQECIFNLNPVHMEPPKEKPPPPPIEASDDEETSTPNKASLRRLDSTKRIKKEIRQKRSSFLGIEANEDDSYLDPELELVRPPDISTLLAEERRIDRQLYRQSVCSESDSNQESRDSGVELDHKLPDTWSSHSRNDSEIYGNQSTTSEEDEIMKKEREIIETLEQEEKIRKQDLGEKLAMRLRELEVEKDRIDWEHQNNEIQNYHIHPYKEENSALLNENLLMREKNRHERPYLQEKIHPTPCNKWYDQKMVAQEAPLPVTRRPDYNDNKYHNHYRKSLQDLSHAMPGTQMLPINYDNVAHRRSMPNLQEMPARRQPPPPPIIPEKPHHFHTNMNNPSDTGSQQMTRQTLQALSAAPRSRLISNDTWQAKRKQTKPEHYNYQHWLIQEAEHRRITEQQQRQQNCVPVRNGSTQHPCRNLQKFPNGQYYPEHRPQPTIPAPHQPYSNQQRVPQGSNKNNKPLPDSIIQTLTQRVQRMNSDNNNNRRRMETLHSENQYTPQKNDNKEKMLSVSGKKRCSHCGEELGRGAAMIIESLQLFYHIDCFKCCVCCLQLGDGLMGTDVRVRNNKLHCHNCYSSDDGAKFSCV